MTVAKIHASQCQGASPKRAVALRLNSIRNPADTKFPYINPCFNS